MLIEMQKYLQFYDISMTTQSYLLIIMEMELRTKDNFRKKNFIV